MSTAIATQIVSAAASNQRRLIAATPELLDALVAASDWIDAQLSKPRTEIQARVRQAIAKATRRAA